MKCSIKLTTRRLLMHFNHVLGKQVIADNPSLDWRSYEVIQPELASSPVISYKRVPGIISEAIVLFSSRCRMSAKLKFLVIDNESLNKYINKVQD